MLAVCSDRGDCQLLEFLGSPGGHVSRESASTLALIARTAHHGPPCNQELCAPLGDDIYELRKAGLRVLFFYDMEHTIVLSHAYKKQSAKLGRGQKERALAARTAYFEAKRSGRLEVIGI